jgi:hypothetical protein
MMCEQSFGAGSRCLEIQVPDCWNASDICWFVDVLLRRAIMGDDVSVPVREVRLFGVKSRSASGTQGEGETVCSALRVRMYAVFDPVLSPLA